MSLPRQLQAAAKWRAQFNPLRSLTFQRAVSLLEGGERGAYAELMWTYRFIEKREATLRALKHLRLSALGKLDWDIKSVDDSPAAKAQAETLRAAYDRVENLREAIRFLGLATFRGFAHLEKRYAGDNPAGGIVRLEPVEQWFMARDTIYGPWVYNPAASSGTISGTPIDPAHFVIRDIEDPINEIGLICFLRKNLSQKDWDAFIEVYGIDPLFIEMPAQVPPEKEKEYQAMAEAVVGDMRGALPNGAKVQTVTSGARGVNPFQQHLDYQDAQLVLAGTSGKLTMLNGPTGLGSGQSDVHADTFAELAQAEAGEISEIFQRQLDRVLLNLAPGVRPLAYFELAAKDQTDVGQLLDHAVKASQAGFRLDAAELAEKTGLKLTVAPVAAAPAFGGGAPGSTFNRAGALSPDAEALRRASLEKLAKAIQADLAPLRAALQDALAKEDDAAFEAAAAEIRTQLPALMKKQGADSATAKAFEHILGTALINGAAGGAEATATTKNRRQGPLAWLTNLFAR
jgi:phage gp29-like protein